MMRSHLIATMLVICVGANADAAVWKKLDGWKLDGAAQPEDGDSFKIKKAGGKRTLRLYGVDCPEVGGHFPQRNADQAKDFGVKLADIPKWGMKARDFTREFLGNGFTIDECGEPAPPDRDYGIVRDLQGNRLDEALLKAGLARVDRTQKKNMAPWIDGEVKVAPAAEEKARRRFANKLQQIESKARRDKKGIWGGK